MQRREALKHIGISTGVVVASPALLNMMQSCTSEPEGWKPTFMAQDEADMVSQLADIILPKTEDAPGASEVNVVEFIDMYWDQVSTVKYKAKVKDAFGRIKAKMVADHGEDASKWTAQNYTALLDNTMLDPKDEKPEPPGTNNEYEEFEHDLPISESKFLKGIKYMTINAYLNSEQVGEQVLVYDPIPGDYICGDLQELTGGKKYSM